MKKGLLTIAACAAVLVTTSSFAFLGMDKEIKFTNIKPGMTESQNIPKDVMKNSTVTCMTDHSDIAAGTIKISGNLDKDIELKSGMTKAEAQYMGSAAMQDNAMSGSSMTNSNSTSASSTMDQLTYTASSDLMFSHGHTVVCKFK